MTSLRPPRLPGGRLCRRAGAVLAAAALAALALATVGSGAAQAATANAATTPGCAATVTSDATWMGDLRTCLQDHTLGHIVIPGSHDSLTYGFISGPAIATTQDKTVAQQLDLGIRSFDMRVGYHNGNYYAVHGGIYSSTLTLSDVFTSVEQWALAKGHDHELIMLGLQVDTTGGTYPTAACQAFGTALGGSLVTPAELQAHFGTSDPGAVTLQQLWSLPDPLNAARVMISDDQCNVAADPSAGTWPSTPFGSFAWTSYYANQCSAFGQFFPFADQGAGVEAPVLQAARLRATQGGGTPDALGATMNGGLWTLYIQGTPSADCPTPPPAMAPFQIQVLNALKNEWLAEPLTRNNVNIIAGDFVEVMPLADDAIAMDERLGQGPGYEEAFQASTGTLDSVGYEAHKISSQSMMPGTSPAVASLPGGGYEIAFQNRKGNLELAGTADVKDSGVAMMPGTSPAITWQPGGGYEVAVQASGGNLETVGPAGTKDWALGMKAGTSPAITVVSGGYEVAFQANSGNLWTVGSGSGSDNHGDWGLGMMAGTSPAITSLQAGGYEVAFQANTGSLWTEGSGAGADNHGDWGLGMMAGTSPSIAGLLDAKAVDGGYEVAFQANTGHLWNVGAGPLSRTPGDTGAVMKVGTSPAITMLPDGTYQVAFQASNQTLAVLPWPDAGSFGQAMTAGTSPSISAIQW